MLAAVTLAPLALGPSNPALRVLLLIILWPLLFGIAWFVAVRVLDSRRPSDGPKCPECGMPREEPFPLCPRCMMRKAQGASGPPSAPPSPGSTGPAGPR